MCRIKRLIAVFIIGCETDEQTQIHLLYNSGVRGFDRKNQSDGKEKSRKKRKFLPEHNNNVGKNVVKKITRKLASKCVE